MFQWLVNLFNKIIAAFKSFIQAVFPTASQLIIGKLKDFAVKIVSELSLSDLTNEEKREAAFDKIKAEAISQGLEVRDSLINLLIEMAVAYLKNQVA